MVSSFSMTLYMSVWDLCVWRCLYDSLKLGLNLKLKPNKTLDENSSLSHGASPAIWDNTALLATQAGTQFTYPGGIEGWVDLGYLAMHRPGIELAISRSQVRRPNHYTTELTNDVDVDDVAGLTECVRHGDAVSTGVVRSNSVDDQTRHFIAAHHFHLHHQDNTWCHTA